MNLKTSVLSFLLWFIITPVLSQNCDQREWSGTVKYHDVTDALTACGINPVKDDTMYAALRASDYDADRLCNTCIEIESGDKSVVVKIMDKSGTHGLDIHKKMFAKLGDTTLGNLEATWSIVACPVTGTIGYRYTSDSYEGEKKIEIVNSRNGISKLHFRRTGTNEFNEIYRASGNPNDFFVMRYADDFTTGPYDFMLEDLYGHVITDYNIPFTANETFYGNSQMPHCGSITQIRNSSIDSPYITKVQEGFIIQDIETRLEMITIYSITGQLMLYKKIQTNSYISFTSQLPPGLYILCFKNQKIKLFIQ